MQLDRWAIAAAAVVQLVLFVRWLYRRIRNDELMRVFIEDIAENHLPHIYALLEKICHQLARQGGQGIDRDDLPPAPPIRWLDLNRK